MNTKDVKKTAFMKKNEINNVNENMVENTVVMDQETMEAIIEDNLNLIPKNQMKKFQQLSTEEKMKKVAFYQDRAEKIAAWKEKASIENRVKELFEKRHATVDDAKKVIEFAQNFIDNFREREIAKIDEQIAALEEMKLQFA